MHSISSLFYTFSCLVRLAGAVPDLAAHCRDTAKKYGDPVEKRLPGKIRDVIINTKNIGTEC